MYGLAMIEVISLSGHLSNIDETFDAGIEIYASKLITKKAEKSGSEFLCNFKCHIRHCEGGGADYMLTTLLLATSDFQILRRLYSLHLVLWFVKRICAHC